MKKFEIKELLEKAKQASIEHVPEHKKDARFEEVIRIVEEELDEIDKKEKLEDKALLRRRNAILGVETAVEYYKVKIAEILSKKELRKEKYPNWYETLEDALYNEILGFFGIAKWLNDDAYEHSDSCLIIGDRIFFEEKGQMVLQEQKISREKRDRLKETLMLNNPKENRAAAWHELYSNKKRVTIFNDNGVAKENQDTLVFRKYHIPDLTLAKEVEWRTIQEGSEVIFENIVKLAYNVAITGAVKSSKTSFLKVLEALEDEKLTALAIETDPEIDFHDILPRAPIIQMVPNDENMDTVIERAKRSDAKRITVAEARNGKMLDIANETANMGTRHLKMSFHNTETIDFVYDVAEKITRDVGGNLLANMIKTAKTYQYVINMWALPHDESKKRLKGIWEICLDTDKMEISMNQICRYVQETDSWVWSYHIGERQREIGMEQNPKAFIKFEKTLKQLSEKYPDPKPFKHVEPYMKILLAGGRL